VALCAQVAFRCYYTALAVSDRQLYPTFTRVSGRAGRRDANIFDALDREFGLRRFVLFRFKHDKATSTIAAYIKKAIVYATVESVLIREESDAVDDFEKHLIERKEKHEEAGLHSPCFMPTPTVSR